MNEKPILPHITPELEARFEANVDKSNPLGCWLWKGDRNARRGYGRFRFQGKRWRAHRVAHVLATRREVPEGMLVSHRCNNPACVNPRHLTADTLGINKLHEIAARRHAHGSRIGSAKLTEDDARRAFDMIRAGQCTHAEIAASLNISVDAIDDIASGRAWRHVTGLARRRSTPHRKLDAKTANAAVALLAQGVSKREVAARLGIGVKLVRDVARGDVLLERAVSP